MDFVLKMMDFAAQKMSDMGNYLANYSSAQCMSWGKNRGCEFVESRCELGHGEDLSIKIDPRDPGRGGDTGGGVGQYPAGTTVCAGHGFNEMECQALGCCSWNAAVATAAGGVTVEDCVSAVGSAPCAAVEVTDPRAYERSYIKSWGGQEQRCTGARYDLVCIVLNTEKID